MIAKMKKLYLVLLESRRTVSMEKLREAGVVHLEDCAGMNETLGVLKQRQGRFIRALRVLDEYRSDASVGHDSTALPAEEAVDRILELTDAIKMRKEALGKALQELHRIGEWGDFDPKSIEDIEAAGKKVRLFQLSRDQYKALLARNEEHMNGKDRSIWIFPLAGRDKTVIRCVSVGPVDIPQDIIPFKLPDERRSFIEQEIQETTIALDSMDQELKKLVSSWASIEQALSQLEEAVEFESATAGLGVDEGLCYLKGYVPAAEVQALKASAAEHGWALRIEDPAADDNVPTLVQRPGPVKVIKPVFDLMGTTPGYMESDISFMFLLSFTLFVAMIVGDAGYGLIFLALGAFGYFKMPAGKRLPFTLTMVLAAATIAWGAVTGTWFGSESLASFSFFKAVVIPSIASFPEEGVNSVQAVQLFCFSIGLVHLSLARLEMFFRTLPRLKAFAELGWWLMLCGLYILVLKIVLGLDGLFGYELSGYTVPLLVSGFALVVVFSNQDGRFFKGLLAGLNPINLLLNFLDGVSAFSNIISYVRLFAVGLASVAVASSFNQMAAGIGFTGPAAIGASLVLFIGHGLNIVMGVMSIVVHGIRLNMLEYSGQLGLEWSGFPYEPFARRA
ncbi:MAG: hypothetical protein JXB03_08350 [Spirochaetales bacterium]|nr:hypothetical protein [Spirochaetales bacterium]